MSWHGAQTRASAPTKGYIQTGAHARSGTKTEQGLETLTGFG